MPCAYKAKEHAPLRTKSYINNIIIFYIYFGALEVDCC